MSIRRPTRNPRSRGRSFRPPHCPNRECPYYTPSPGWEFVRNGLYTRPSDGRSFQRFRCNHCRRGFSTRTFAADYWLKRRDLLPRVASLCTEAAGLRQTGRDLGAAPSTVGLQLSRAGRLCMLLHQRTLLRHSLNEPLVVDGFETFEHSQFFPFHLNLAVGAKSWLLYHFTDSPLRRKGSMTPAQKKKREMLEERLGRPDPKAVENGMIDLLRHLLRADPVRPKPDPSSPLEPGPERVVVLHSDDHPAYRRALRRLRQEPGIPKISHRVTSSKERRTCVNPLFPVNLADLLLRHSQAAHRRETIAFCKRRQGAIERMAVFTVWRNLVKSRREKKPGPTTAMAIGVMERPWRWADVFRRRRFPRAELLPGPWSDYYWRKVKTPVLGEPQTEHRLKYAF